MANLGVQEMAEAETEVNSEGQGQTDIDDVIDAGEVRTQTPVLEVRVVTSPSPGKHEPPSGAHHLAPNSAS